MKTEPLTNGHRITINEITGVSLFDADPRLMNSLDGVFCKVLKIRTATGKTILINLFADEPHYLNFRKGDRV